MSEHKHSLEPIAYYEGPLHSKFGLPRQAGLVRGLPGTLRFTEEFHDMVACRGLEGFSHIWLIWSFSEVPEGKTAHTVRPPRLKGNTRMGVFATRSPFRPNRLGLSCVKLEQIGPGPCLHISGADLLDGTPIYDIKPYIPYADALPEAAAAYAQEAPKALEVEWSEQAREQMPEEKRRIAGALLAQDPRPAYQQDPERIYGLEYENYNLRFKVSDKLYVLEAEQKPASAAAPGKTDDAEAAEEEKSPYYVYMLSCSDGTLYTGIAKDPENRLAQHNNGSGAKYTRSRRPCRLSYLEKTADKSTALKREYAIKQKSRRQKLDLIRSYQDKEEEKE